MKEKTSNIDIAPAVYQLPLEESYRLQLEACVDYYRTQLGYQFEIDRKNVKIMEQNAKIEAQNAILKEQGTTDKIKKSATQILEKALNANKTALQTIADIDNET